MPVPNRPGGASAQTIAYGVFLFVIGIILAGAGGATGSIILDSFGALSILIAIPLMIIGWMAYNRAQKKARQTPAPNYPPMNPYPQAYPQSMQPINLNIQTPGSSTHSEVTREIVKVRCKSCSSLNFETANRCVNCGASL